MGALDGGTWEGQRLSLPSIMVAGWRGGSEGRGGGEGVLRGGTQVGTRPRWARGVAGTKFWGGWAGKPFLCGA